MKPQYEDENLKNQLNLNFLSNKIKGVQSSKKQLTPLNFLNNKIGLNKRVLIFCKRHTLL